MEINNIQNFDFYALGQLTSILQHSNEEWGHGIFCVELQFTNGTLVITANEDDDTILLRTNSNFEALREDEPGWICKVSNILEKKNPKSLLWVWELTNQQGYTDGLQFHFSEKNTNHPNDLLIQFVVLASTIQTYVLQIQV